MSEENSIIAVIFSKDRALQLDAALRSLQESCRDITRCNRVVIYACSHQRHERHYETLKEWHPGVRLIREKDFQADLSNALRGHSHVLFLVDDNVFVKQWTISPIASLLTEHSDAIGFSLRLGRNTTFCYSLHKPQPLPEFEELPRGVLKFRWPGNEGDFSYPLEVSSSVYRVDDLLPLIEGAEDIRNPNLLERFLDRSKSNLAGRLPFLLCFQQSAAFCIPINVVQTQYVNRRGSDSSFTPAELLRRFDLGYRVDLKPFEGFVPSSCHQLVAITFLAPQGVRGLISANINISHSATARTAEGTEKAAGEVSEVAEASCQINLDSLEMQDQDSLQSLWNLIRDACRTKIATPWLSNLAKAMYEDRQLDLFELAQRTLELQKLQLELQKLQLERQQLQASAAEAEMGKAWLAEQMEQWMQTANKDELVIQDLQHQLSEVYNSRSYKLAGLFSNAAKSKISFVLLPLRLLLFVLPSRIKEPLRNLVQPLLQKYRNKEPKHITLRNTPWPHDTPLVSVVIPRHNGNQQVEETIDSVVSQTWKDLEIIVVDDRPADANTMPVLEDVNKPIIRILRQENVNLSEARNAGILKAHGKYICCLDAADRLAPTYLEKCLFRLENEGLDICGSWGQDFGDSRQIRNPEPFSLEKLLQENCLVAASVFRKELWSSVGGYDETVVDGDEGLTDWDFWVRMAEAGAHASNIQEPLYSRRRPEKAMLDDEQLKKEQAAEHIRMKHRHLLDHPKKVARIGTQRDLVRVEGGLCNLIVADRHPPKGSTNVLLAMPFLVVGGAETIVSQICQYLSTRDVRFTLITSITPNRTDGDTTALFEKSTPEIYHLPRFLSESQWQTFIFYLLETRNINLLWQVGSSYVYDLMPEIKTHFPKLRILDFLFNEVGHTANNRKYNYCIDLMLAENERVKDWLIAHGETADRIKCFRSGVDLAQYAPIQDKQAVRYQLGIGDGLLVGYCGRFSEEKSPESFIEIADRLRHLEGVEFLMTGAGPLMQQMRSQIAKLEFGNRFHFFGTVPDVKPYLGSCDALILPSRLDGRPTAVLQALAMGVPVIASNVGALPEIITDHQNGFLCEVGNVGQFVEAVKLLASDSALRSKLSQGARRYAEDELDVRRWFSDIETLLKGLV